MSESTIPSGLTEENPALIGVVCDHCSTAYQVSCARFKDDFKQRFHCGLCDQDWVEYLDFPLWKEVRKIGQDLARLEAAHIEQEQQRAATEEAERAAKAAKKQAELEAEKLTKEAAQAEHLAGGRDEKPLKTKPENVAITAEQLTPGFWDRFSLRRLSFFLVLLLFLYVGSAGYLYAEHFRIIEENLLASVSYAIISISALPLRILRFPHE